MEHDLEKLARVSVDFVDGVVNANLSNGLTALSGQAASTAQLVAQITKTAVPSSAICNFNSGCGSCCSSVNI